jgi:hypothetical protein
MAKLKNRQLQIPGGLRFRILELKFETPPFTSFDVIVNTALRVVLANPEKAARNGWPTTREGMCDWVDRVNAGICEHNGWGDYIISTGPPPPKSPAPEQIKALQSVAGAVRKLSAGASLIIEWDQTAEPPVTSGVAEHRASICAACPNNGRGALTGWFTVPISNAIRGQMEKFHDMSLTTTLDDKLGVCGICLCPLKLKVHTPQALVEKHMSEEVRKDLPEFCWMLGR